MSKWEMVRLGDVGEIVTGSTPTTADGAFYEFQDIPFYKPNDIDTIRISKLKSASCYVDERARKKIRVLPYGTVLVTCIGIIGKVAIVLNMESATNQQINAVVPNRQICNSEYLAYAVFSRKTYMQDIANAPIVPIINKKNFSQIEIPLPPLEEQKKIAAELDKISDLIAKRKAQIEKLDLLIKAKFIEMFGDPVTNPMGWDTGTIRDVVTDVKYGTSNPACENGKYIYLRMNNITYDGHLDLSNLKYIDIEEKDYEKCVVRKGDVLFNRTNSKELVGKTCVFNENTEMIIAGYIIRLRTNSKAIPVYLSRVLNSKYGKETLYNMCKSIVGQANINAQELQNIKILIPPVLLQKQFENCVYQVEQKKTILRQSLWQLELLYKQRMQNHFE